MKKIILSLSVLFLLIFMLTACSEDDVLGDIEQAADLGDRSDRFEISADDEARYRRSVILDVGTENEEEIITYDVPEGEYRVTNVGDRRGRFNIYRSRGYNDIVKSEDKVYEKEIGVEQTEIIIIKEGEYITIDDSVSFELERKE